jgi:hypothetical protein
VKSTPADASVMVSASSASSLSAEDQIKALEENKAALKELQEEMAVYRRERAENERLRAFAFFLCG